MARQPRLRNSQVRRATSGIFADFRLYGRDGGSRPSPGDWPNSERFSAIREVARPLLFGHLELRLSGFSAEGALSK